MHFCRRNPEAEIKEANVIIVDGTFILHNEAIRQRLNIKIFVETDEDVRLSRRVLKYMEWFEKKMSLEDFLTHYMKCIKPGFEKYVEPSKKYADIIVPNYGFSLEEAKLGSMCEIIMNRNDV